MIVNALKLFFAVILFGVESFAVYRLLDSRVFVSRKKIAVSCLFWSLICLITYQPIYSSIAPIINYLTLCLVLSYIFQIPLVKSFVATGVTYLIATFGDILGALILGMFFNLNELRNSLFYLIIGNLFVITFVLSFSFFSLFRKKLMKLVSRINYEKERSIILFLFLAIVFISITGLHVTASKMVWNDLIIIFIPLFILFILTILYIFERNKYQTLNSQYEALFTHATSLESWLENERLSYHEYKNQLAYIRSIVEEKEAIEYIDSILQESFENSAIVDTQIANIPKGGMKGLIFYKLIQAQRKGIDSYVSISPKMKSLNVGKDIEKSKTVCRIFGILLDNAIDAATESDERRISLEMYRLDQKLIFVVMNTFKGDFNVAKIQEKGYTTKGKGHGNGLNYVRNIIARDNRYTLQTSLIGGYYTQKVTIEE